MNKTSQNAGDEHSVINPSSGQEVEYAGDVASVATVPVC